MAQTIFQNNKECYITQSTSGLHKHHIFGSANRKKSEKYGLWVWLRADWHNMSDYGVHFNKELSYRIKREAQAAAMQKYGWTKEQFIAIFGRNYL